MHLVRDLLDQLLVDPSGEPAGRADDFSLTLESDGIFVDAILSGGGVLADDLGFGGRVWEGIARTVRRRNLRRTSIPWISVSEVAEHALTVVSTQGAAIAAPRTPSSRTVRLRVARRLPLRTADGTPLHLVDLQLSDMQPAPRIRVTGLIIRPRHRFAWPTSLRPRTRGPSHDWRFVPAASVRVTPAELVVEQAYDALEPMRASDVKPPPKRVPLTDA
jgi:hypothetical protein